MSDWFSSSFSLVSVIRGQVLTADGTPLIGVNVTFVHYPEHGYTVTRKDGMWEYSDYNSSTRVDVSFHPSKQTSPFRLRLYSFPSSSSLFVLSSHVLTDRLQGFQLFLHLWRWFRVYGKWMSSVCWMGLNVCHHVWWSCVSWVCQKEEMWICWHCVFMGMTFQDVKSFHIGHVLYVTWLILIEIHILLSRCTLPPSLSPSLSLLMCGKHTLDYILE